MPAASQRASQVRGHTGMMPYDQRLPWRLPAARRRRLRSWLAAAAFAFAVAPQLATGPGGCLAPRAAALAEDEAVEAPLPVLAPLEGEAQQETIVNVDWDSGAAPAVTPVAPEPSAATGSNDRQLVVEGVKNASVPSDRAAWAAELCTVMSRRSAAAFGARGEALAVAIPSALLLSCGVWLAAGPWTPVRAATWFVVGAVLGLAWALHPSTAPGMGDGYSVVASVHFAIAVAIHVGVAFALFNPAGRFAAGTLSAIAVAHGLGALPPLQFIPAVAAGRSFASQLSSTFMLTAAGLAGAVAAHRYEKTGVCALSSLAGGCGLAWVLHWCGRWGWLVLRNVEDPEEYNTPLAHLGRLVGGPAGADGCGCGMAEYSLFTALWVNLSILGFLLQRGLFGCLWDNPVGLAVQVSEEAPQAMQRTTSGHHAGAFPVFSGGLSSPAFKPTEAPRDEDSLRSRADEDDLSIYLPAAGPVPATGPSSILRQTSQPQAGRQTSQPQARPPGT